MNIADLQQTGFVSGELVKRAIEWDGNKGEVFVRRVSFAVIAATQSLPEGERMVALVRECVRLGDGDVQLTAEQAGSLKPSLAAAMLAVIGEVNQLGKEAGPKN